MIQTLYEPWFSVSKLFSLERMKAGTFKKVEQAEFYAIFIVLPRANLKHASLLLHKFLSQCQILWSCILDTVYRVKCKILTLVQYTKSNFFWWNLPFPV